MGIGMKGSSRIHPCGKEKINPAMTESAEVFSCARFGRSKREAEDFVGSFVEVSITQRLRVMGDDVRLHKCYPGNWQARTALISAPTLPLATFTFPAPKL